MLFGDETLDGDEEIVPLVLDIGSCTTRIGFGGDDAPRVTDSHIPNQVNDKV